MYGTANEGNLPVFSRHDEEFLLKKGKRKAFHVGGNSSCQQHICGHYSVYQAKYAEQGIKENHHAVPCEVKSGRMEAKKLKRSGQQTLDAMMKTPWAKEFLRENILKSVAEFVVCDNQVSQPNL